MDSIIEKKKGIRPKHILIAVIAILFLYFTFNMIFGKSVSTYNVDKEQIIISEVVQDKFNDYISINGVVKPISTVYLDAYEGGRVSELFIQEGSEVKKGDVILKLENRSLYEQILTSENNLAIKQNNLRETKINFESQRILGQKDRLEAEYRLIKAKRKHAQYSSLYNDGLVAKEEYLDSKEDFELSQKRYEVIKFKTLQDSLLHVTGIKDLDSDLRRMKKTLELVYERIEHLNLKAPVDGQLGMLNAEIGQRFGQGQRIGQINVLTDYKIQSEIDEHYIDRVSRGLTGSIERNGKLFNVQLKKVYPEVREGKFKIDLIFSAQKPPNIRTGQSYYIKLQLGAPMDALLIPRGSFFQSTAGQWVYVVDASGDFAIKREVSIGRQNPKFYEVLDGLEPGEKVIISSYDTFGDSDKLSLK
ncbi:MAG: biotin/lipoyl-binding protein [Maribacter sp.]|nr:biotin/lipoyl-binding protein [Maribacter sp.]